ncbi:hypothetical protein [Aliterella atlantica]|uniref:Uncharacterized protein n=1 Tax=Aliterella atlantica CENA595 TaxID=1618023 RepID=A0A0D8ZY68_9CYAN|nr:hypothetical protein [Aliterella atlantica]KJH73404.1 hypothetical protein UH38_01095 [Aliterella atlantica CENA595]
MLDIPEKSLGQREIYLKDAHGHLLPAIVDLGCLDWNEGGRRRTECRITLKWADSEVNCVDWNFFESFKQVRQQLALLGLYPLCYGASRNIVITGMAIDMGLGMKIYKGATLNTFPTRNQLVGLFDFGDDVEPVSVEEQEAFRQEWVKSVRTQV